MKGWVYLQYHLYIVLLDKDLLELPAVHCPIQRCSKLIGLSTYESKIRQKKQLNKFAKSPVLSAMSVRRGDGEEPT